MTDDAEKWIAKHAPNKRLGILLLELERGATLAEAGAKASFGSGRSSDPEEKRRNWAAAASRATKTERYRNLRERYLKWKQFGDPKPIADTHELEASLTRIARGDNPNASIQAAKVLLSEGRAGRDAVPESKISQIVDAACRSENLFIKCLGTSAGIVWKRGGASFMEGWKTPDDLAHIEALMSVDGVRHIDVLELVIAQEQAKK